MRRCNRPSALWLLLLLAFASASAQNPAPGASAALAGTADAFLSGCRSDLKNAKKRVSDIKASRARDAYATLQAFDTAILFAYDAQSRAGLAEQVHPAKDFRDA